jgi:transposase
MYCVTFRQKVLDFCGRVGNSLRKAAKIFDLSPTTIVKWKRLQSEGALEGQTTRPNRKLDLEALKSLLFEAPDLLQSEMAAHFCVCENTIRYGLRKIGYKRKKKRPYTKKETNKKDKNILML